MKLEDLKSKKIAILGFGQEGQAVFSYLQKHGVKADILDKKQSGENYLGNLSDYNVIFRSPGIWRHTPEILQAEKNGSTVTSQAKFFFENCPAKIVGVTGTKGKGTTCSLIYNILQKAGINSYLTGNIGKVQPFEFLDELKETDVVVYELSSFQLQDLESSPDIGICLMVTADHLDHHKDLEEYHIAKSAITKFQSNSDSAIYNIDYSATKEIGKQGQGQKFEISSKETVTNGILIESEKNILHLYLNGSQTTIDCSNRKLRGFHNLENIAAASLAAISLGVNTETIIAVINEFKGLEHRLEFVGEYNDISYYNDSISTVPETTLAAINSFTEPVNLILGGSDKGLDYENLVSELIKKPNIASITLLGETGGAIKLDLEKQNSQIPTYGVYTNFNDAMENIFNIAKSGEVVLLSPASASFDMFENYADRGRKFVELVKNKLS